MNKLKTVLGAIAIGAMTLVGCDLIDCGGLCDRCRDNANTDSSYMNRVSACHACITDKDCAAASFNCGTACAGIVP